MSSLARPPIPRLAGPDAVTGAALAIPRVIDHHMVLQRRSLAPLWGRAQPGAPVTVTLSAGPTAATRADDAGRWRLELPTGEAGGPYTLSIAADAAEPIVLEDVFVGEVWLCGGQSNMAFGMKQVVNAETEIASADYPLIRHLFVPRTWAAQPQEDQEGQWKVCTPQNVAASQFSGVAYYFARRLQEELGEDMPIGLLNSTWGGTRIEPWTPPQGFAQIASLAKMSMALPPGLAEHQAPSATYNAMIHPIQTYRVRGMIWYQGESNHREVDYVDKSIALVKGWRQVWQRDLPFYYVQVAPFDWKQSPYDILPRFWAQQARVEQVLDDSYMVVITDVGDVDDLHPRNKRDVGRRLANRALVHTYGRTDIADASPRFAELIPPQEGDTTLRVRFEHTYGQLKSRDGKPPDHFEIAGASTKWLPATATIDGDCVLLHHPDVDKPIAARFGWHKTAQPNLVNAAGLPASPFCAT